MERLTNTRKKILLELYEAAPGWLSGPEVMTARRIASGSFYPSMRELRKSPWIEWDWKHPDGEVNDTPLAYYKLTPMGVGLARSLEAGEVVGLGWKKFIPAEWRWSEYD